MHFKSKIKKIIDLEKLLKLKSDRFLVLFSKYPGFIVLFR